MTAVDDLIAALTAAVDHPNPSPPPVTLAGTASKGDQIPAQQLITELQAANLASIAAAGRYAAAQVAATTAETQYTASHAAWIAARDASFAAWDRGLRALETLILTANPSALVNPAIHITTGDVPGAMQRSDSSSVLAKSLSVSAEAIRGERTDREYYFRALDGEPQPDGRVANALQLAQTQASGAEMALSQVMARATTYLTYLGVT